MKMLLVQHRDGETWVDSYREDLSTAPDVLLAVFYTVAEAEAYITAMCGLIHCGGRREDFRLLHVVHDGEGIASGEAVRS